MPAAWWVSWTWGGVSACENYGDIASTDGGYVGGIAGASWGTIRDSWVKCHLSGGDYIGGVAGLGATLENCHTLVEIEEGSAYLGAVAGDVDADAAVSDNTFTSERLGALDGISYAGHAEPVDFDTLCTTPGVPGILLPAGADLCGGRRGGRGRPLPVRRGD